HGGGGVAAGSPAGFCGNMPFMDPMQLLISLMVFAAVFLLVFTVFRYPVPAGPPVHRRIARALGADRATVFEQAGLAPVLNFFVNLASRLNLPKVRAEVRQDLDASGNAYGYTVDQYLALCLASATSTALLFGLSEFYLGGGLLLI